VKVSLNWVKEFTSVDCSTRELIDLAVARLGGVEGYQQLGRRYRGVVVAEVKSAQPHPDADKLSICLVDDDGAVKDVERNDDGLIQVVCGANNVEAGQLIAWIPPGATVPSTASDEQPFVLESRELRGQMSHGMIASPKELGLSDEHDGILVIDEPSAESGQDFSELYELDDTIIDIENKMFTHRPDGFGQLGVARELAGIQHQAFTSPSWYNLSETIDDGISSDVIKQLSVQIDEPELCPRYMAVALEGVAVQPSPSWLQSRLSRVGIRPINNVVDITNYVMLLTAQPIHAFDFDKIAVDGAASISVRKPKADEQLPLLDGTELTPRAEAVLICNDDGPIALGGVMGGANSEVDEHTSRLVIECANFNMYNIRRTSMEHGLFTEAVTRFSKGQSSQQIQPVLAYAVSLFQEVCGAKVVGEPVDVNHAANQANPEVKLDVDFINQRLGTDLDMDTVTTLLQNVELHVATDGDELRVTAPFWRTDIEIKEDVVEEVGRLYGFDQLSRQLPGRTTRPSVRSPLAQTKIAVQDSLRRIGANELSTHSFVNDQLMQRAEQDVAQAFELSNALSRELQYYRLSPLPSLLSHVHGNIKAGHDEFTLFELAATHNRQHHADDDDGLPSELQFVDMAYAARKPRSGAAFYQLRATLDQLLQDLGIDDVVYKPIEQAMDYPVTAPFEQTRSALVESADGQFIGMIGELKQTVIDNFKLPDYSAAATLDLESISKQHHQQSTGYQPLPRFPMVSQDVTVATSADVHYQQLLTDFTAALEQRLADSQSAELELIAIYQADGNKQKHTSWRVSLRDDSATLKAETVDQLLNETVATTDCATRV